jgi:hypothetical protein
VVETRPYLRARVRPAPEALDETDALEIDALLRNIKTNFQQVVSLSPLLSDDLQTLASNITEPGRLTGFHRLEPDHDRDVGEAGGTRDARRACAHGRAQPDS